MKKIKIDETIKRDGQLETVDVYCSDIGLVIEGLNRINNEHGARYDRIYLKLQQTCGCYHECLCPQEIVFTGQREETDEEYDARLNAQTLRQERKEQQNKQLLEQMAKEAGYELVKKK